jgi:hypothetical protein
MVFSQISVKYGCYMTVAIQSHEFSFLLSVKRHNSIAPRLYIVLAINSIYTKSGNFHHRLAHRLSIIGPIVTISRLSFFASVYSTICTKSTVIAYKDCYKQSLYFGLPSVA